MKKKKPYKVTVDNLGCEYCGEGRNYSVIGPDKALLGESFHFKADARVLANRLNDAYLEGYAKAVGDLHNL